MNDLFLIMWLADVVCNAQPLLIVFGIVFSIISGVVFTFGISEEHSPSLRFAKVILPIAMLLFVFAVALPSKNTLYVLAAAKVGQEIATTPLAQKAYQAADAVLDKVISEAKK